MRETLLTRLALTPGGRRLGLLLSRRDTKGDRDGVTALQRVAAAFPSLTTDRRRAIVAESVKLAAMARWDARWLAKASTPTFCRRVSLEGWEPVARALRAGRGLVIATAAAGSAEIATLAARLWGEPLQVLRLDRPENGRGVPFLAGAASADPSVGREVARIAAPVVALFAIPGAGDRYRLMAGTEIEAGTPAPVVTARLATEVERVVRARPEIWEWVA